MLNKENSFTNSRTLQYSPKVTYNNETNYKQRATVLFNKLNTMKTSLENQKHSKFSQVMQQLKHVETSFEQTCKDKQQHFQKILTTLTSIDKQINYQRTQYSRFQKILQNMMQSTNKQCQKSFDKMTKQFENNQIAIQKYIDFKIQSFILKNKGTWLEQDLLNFQPFKQELLYLKKEVQSFYFAQGRQAQKLKKQMSQTLQRQKEFLLLQLRRKDNEEIMTSIEGVHAEMTRKLGEMIRKREKVEQTVLEMIENVINSQMREVNKFK